MTTWRLMKTGGDEYHIHGNDPFTQIEEDVDGPKLLGMLAGKGFSIEDAQLVVLDLDGHGIGFQKTIALPEIPIETGDFGPPFEHQPKPDGIGCAEGCAACEWLEQRGREVGV